jgi:hypothetical protein
MKRFFLLSGVCFAILSLCPLVSFTSHAQQAGTLEVAEASICKDVVNREAIEPGDSFAASVGRLYCFSSITGIENSTEIIHTWYYGETQRAQVTLGVQPPHWRTYSSKIIQAHEIGTWRVEITDASGNLLEKIQFEITQ